MKTINYNYNSLNYAERPELYLGNPNQDIIGRLKDNSELVFDLYLNNISKLSFTYYKTIDGNESLYYDKIENRMTILAQGIGWFIVTSVRENKGGMFSYKDIECSSLEFEFIDKNLTSFGQLGSKNDWDGGLDLYKLYDITKPDKSILHIVLAELPAWKVGTIDSNIKDGWRSFTDDNVTAYDFLTGSVSETYDCIFVFDTFSRTVNAYSLEALEINTGIILSYRNLITNISFSSNANDIKTRMSVYGGDDRGSGNLNIIECNATGTSIIENYDYFMDKMSLGLREHYNTYKQAYTSNSQLLSNALSVLSSMYDTLYNLQYKSPTINSQNWSEYGLVHLQEFQDNYEVLKSEAFNNPTVYVPLQATYNAITTELNLRKQQVNSQNQQITNQTAICNSYVVKLSNYLTAQEKIELSRLAYDTTFTDSNFVATTLMTDTEILQTKRDLKTLAEKTLNRICKPQYTLEVDVANYLAMPEFKEYAGKIQLGSLLIVDYDEKGLGRYNVKSRVLHIHINWDDKSDFKLTFSSKNSLDSVFALDELQQEVSTVSGSHAIGSSSWLTQKNNNNDVTTFISGTLDASKNKIISSENQSVVFGEFGLQIKKFNGQTGGYDPKQIWMANGQIAFSKDGFNSVSMALGEVELNGQTVYGVVADAIVGKLIVGNTMLIQNDDATMTFNNNGLSVTNGINTVKINPTSGSSCFEIWNRSNKVLYFDTYGNGYFNGRLMGASGSFSGIVQAGKVIGSEIEGGSININNKFLVDSNGIATLRDGKFIKTKQEDGDIITLKLDDYTYDISVDSNTGVNQSAMSLSHSGLGFSRPQNEAFYANDKIKLTKSGIEKFYVDNNGNMKVSSSISISGASVITSANVGDYAATKTHYQPSTTINPIQTSGGNVGLNGLNVASVNWCNDTFEKKSASDLRLKKNIRNLDELPDDLYYSLSVKLFEYRCTPYNQNISNIGLMAQEVVSAFNKFSLDAFEYGIVEYSDVRPYTDEGTYILDNKLLRVNYNQFIAWSILISQKLHNEICKIKKCMV